MVVREHFLRWKLSRTSNNATALSAGGTVCHADLAQADTPNAGSVLARSSAAAQAHLVWLSSVITLGFALWLGFSWSGYSRRYSQTSEGWQVGHSELVEITLVRDDARNLACASDVTLSGLHCGFHADHTPFASDANAAESVLRPYNTVKNQLFLAAGLWDSKRLPRELPVSRFTVVCNYHISSVMKSAALRWSPNGRFDALDHSVAAGTLSDCEIPK